MTTDADARTQALARLDVLVGAWSLEANFPGAPSGPAGRATFAWDLDRQFLVERAEIPHPDAPDSLAVIAADVDGESFTQHYFDSRGVVRVYAMTFADGRWTLCRDAPDFTPLAFSQRFHGRLEDGDATITGRWESADDGSTWRKDFDLIYRRISEPAAGLTRPTGSG